jgi:hypothetical protein
MVDRRRRWTDTGLVTQLSAFLVPVLAGCLVAGCGGTGKGPSGTPRDGGAGGIPVPGPTLTNLPQATFFVTATEAAAGLELLSSNLLPDPDSKVNYVQWFGEVRNNGTSPACYLKITLDFRAASDTRVLALGTMATADPHKTARTNSPIPCVPPGKTGAFYANQLSAAPVPLAAIAVVEVELDLSPYPDAVPHPASPTLSGLAIVEDAPGNPGRWVVAGTLTATAPLSGVSLNAYYKDESGLILADGTASSSSSLNAGASWSFKTFYYVGAQPSSYLLFCTLRLP